MNCYEILIEEKLYDAFNRADAQDFLNLMDDNVVHDINQGKNEIGKKSFTFWLKYMEPL